MSKMKRRAHIPLSLYIHFPWCLAKCWYCDFNSYLLSNRALVTSYVHKLLVDIEQEAQKYPNEELVSVYLGGGTPSLLSVEELELIINKVKSNFALADSTEITLEINPGTVDLDFLIKIKKIGINRVSIGAQSFNDQLLKNIGRIHGSNQTKEVIRWVKRAGFDSFNLDFIFGLPGQKVKDVIVDLTTAVEFGAPHISWYQLTLDFNQKLKSCNDLPNQEELWAMQQAGQDYLKGQFWQQYEVSAYAKSDKYFCKHNLNYWRFGDYLGVGAGASGKITLDNHQVMRYTKITNPDKYLLADLLFEEQDYIAKEKLPFEFMLNALRLYQPIDYGLFEHMTGLSIQVLAKELQNAEKMQLINLRDSAIVVTEHGKNFLNDLLEIFL